MLLLSSVTPARAHALPDKLAPVLSVMLEYARMFPVNTVPVPSVAPLPTCQNTLPARPPFPMTTDALGAVVSVLAIWKTHTPLEWPRPSTASCPVNDADDVKQ